MDTCFRWLLSGTITVTLYFFRKTLLYLYTVWLNIVGKVEICKILKCFGILSDRNNTWRMQNMFLLHVPEKVA